MSHGDQRQGNLVESAHLLAMLALQSQRYATDPDYRDAVDDVLALVQFASGQKGPTEGPTS